MKKKKVKELENIIRSFTNEDSVNLDLDFLQQIIKAMKSERWNANSFATKHIIAFCKNICAKTMNGHRFSQEFYRYVYYFKYMTNKKGIQLQSLNFGWPSNTSLKSLNVDWFYGMTPTDELEHLLEACSKKNEGQGSHLLWSLLG